MGERARRLAPALGIAIALGTVAFGASGHAQEDGVQEMPGQVRLLLPPCKSGGPFDRKVFIDVLKLELGSHDITIPDARRSIEWTGKDARVVIDVDTCKERGQQARIEVMHLGTGKQAARTVVFTLPERDRRARVLALATAEFLTLKWPSLDDASLAADPEIQALEARLRAAQREDLEALLEERPTQVVQGETGRVSPWLLSIGAQAEFYLELSSAVLGPGVWGSAAVGSHVRIEAGLASGFGRGRALDGDIKIRTVNGTVAVLFGGGGRAWVGVGPRGTVGWARLEGVAFDQQLETRSIDSVVGSLGLQLSARIQLAGSWHAVVDGHAGYGFKRLEGEGDEGVRGGVGGSTVGLVFGAAYGFR